MPAPEEAAPAQRGRQDLFGTRPVASSQQRLRRVGSERVADTALDAELAGQRNSVQRYPSRLMEPARRVEGVSEEHVRTYQVCRVGRVDVAAACLDEHCHALVGMSQVAQVESADVYCPE